MPIDTLPLGYDARKKLPMADGDFQRALLWHMEQQKTTIAQLSDATGVSRDVIAKLRTRPGSSTTVENGMAIAAFYGKSLNQFVAMQDAGDEERLRLLFELLTPEELPLLEAQIRGLASYRR